MLNNKIAYARFIALLNSIDPDVPLPADLDSHLWDTMVVEKISTKARILEQEGKIPKKAYYVVRGFVIVYGFDENKDRYVMRIYRENSIVALNCFMNQKVSVFTIVACKGALLWSITSEQMKLIYKQMPGMEEMALKTALQYSDAKEQVRAKLLALDVEQRILQFYKMFKGLLPASGGPIRNTCIASYLNVSLDVLRRIKTKLKKEGVLKIVGFLAHLALVC